MSPACNLCGWKILSPSQDESSRPSRDENPKSVFYKTPREDFVCLFVRFAYSHWEEILRFRWIKIPIHFPLTLQEKKGGGKECKRSQRVMSSVVLLIYMSKCLTREGSPNLLHSIDLIYPCDVTELGVGKRGTWAVSKSQQHWAAEGSSWRC